MILYYYDIYSIDILLISDIIHIEARACKPWEIR